MFDLGQLPRLDAKARPAALPVLLQIFLGGVREVTGGDEEQHAGGFGLRPRKSILKFGWWNPFVVVLAVNKPEIGEAGAVHIFTLLVSRDVPAAVCGAAVLRCSLPPVEIAEPYAAEKIKAKFFETDAR